MTSAAAEIEDSGIGPGQRQESTSKQTGDTADISVSVGQYFLPGKAEHSQQDHGDIGEEVIQNGNFPNDGTESAAASQAAEQPVLHAEKQQSAVQKSDSKAMPALAASNGWSSHPSLDTDADMEILASDSIEVAAEGPGTEADDASAKPAPEAADSAAASNRPHLSAKQRRMVVRQHAEMVRQHQALVGILQRQFKLAGKDPLAEEVVQQQQATVAANAALPEQRQAAGSGLAMGEPVAPPVKALPAFTSKPGKLAPEAEAKLLIHFGLQDTLTREETQALAAQVGASEAAVRDHIGKLRGNMRAALQRLQRKAASGSPAGAPPRAHVHHAIPGASHAPHHQHTTPAGLHQPRSDNGPSVGTAPNGANGQPAAAPAQQPGTACPSLTARQGLQEIPVTQTTPQAQQRQGVPSPSLAGANGFPQALDLSGLQAILRNAGFPQAAQAVQTDAAKQSTPADAPAPAQDEVPEPSLSSKSHISAPGSSAAASASAAAFTAATPHTQGVLAAGSSLGRATPVAAAAALAAIDKACARDIATLSSMLDPQRSIRHDCTGKLAGALLGVKTAEGRHETLLAMLRTTPAASLMPVALSQRCLDTLAEWSRWGMMDRQTTILRLLLGVLLRLPVPPAMLRTSSLLRAVSSMQSYKVPSVSHAATILLHHWQQQEPSLWPSAPKRPPGPSPSIAPAASQQPHKHWQQPSLQPSGPKPAAQGSALPVNGFGIDDSSTPVQQQPAAPSRAFYRGVAGRIGAEQPTKSASARPLTADEIVQSQLRKRQAASALTRGQPGKVPRLDNKSLLEAAGKRRQGPARHGPMGNGPNSPRMGQQLSKQPPAHTQQPQSSALQAAGMATSPHGAQPVPSAASLQTLLEHVRQTPFAQQLLSQQSVAGGLQAHAASSGPPPRPVRAAQGNGLGGSADLQKGGMTAQQPADSMHRSNSEPKVTVAWYQPPAIDVEYEADLAPGQGAGSLERHTQQMRQTSQPATVYVLPELIPATPGEPWQAADEAKHALLVVPQPVPLLPTEPEEAKATYQWLQSLQLPQEAIVGRRTPR